MTDEEIVEAAMIECTNMEWGIWRFTQSDVIAFARRIAEAEQEQIIASINDRCPRP